MQTNLNRRAMLASLGVGAAVASSAAASSFAEASSPAADRLRSGAEDRQYMLDLLERMANPILSRMSQGQLRRTWKPELSPTWDGRDPAVAFMEGFARLIDGIAPFLALPDEAGAEGALRARLRVQAQQCYVHSVDPKSPDYLLWRNEGQPLVDSAYFTSALLRAPQVLWDPLDARTKARIISEIQGLRRVSPPYTNWLLFAAMNEAFLLSVGAQWDPVRIDLAIRKFGEWYLGDGWYGDGEHFHFDMYNSYVIHPMLTQILDVLVRTGARFNSLEPQMRLSVEIDRMRRLGESLERMIGADGSIPPLGRSLTYRTAAHQPLAYLAWRKLLHDRLPAGQVRAATVAAQRRMFADPSNFDSEGFLTIGFARHQPSLGDVYSNSGSMYIASESLLALGLPATDAYWTAPAGVWTMLAAYGGRDFPKDHFIEN